MDEASALLTPKMGPKDTALLGRGLILVCFLKAPVASLLTRRKWGPFWNLHKGEARHTCQDEETHLQDAPFISYRMTVTTPNLISKCNSIISDLCSEI